MCQSNVSPLPLLVCSLSGYKTWFTVLPPQKNSKDFLPPEASIDEWPPRSSEHTDIKHADVCRAAGHLWGGGEMLSAALSWRPLTAHLSAATNYYLERMNLHWTIRRRIDFLSTLRDHPHPSMHKFVCFSYFKKYNDTPRTNTDDHQNAKHIQVCPKAAQKERCAQGLAASSFNLFQLKPNQ